MAAKETMTATEVLQDLQIEKTELDQLVAQGKLHPQGKGDAAVFSREEVAALKLESETRATLVAGGLDGSEFMVVQDASMGDYITIEDAMAELGVSREEVEKAMKEGKLTGLEDAGTIKFRVAEVRALKEKVKTPPTEVGAYLTLDEALQELQMSRRELDQLTTEGKLSPVQDAGEIKFKYEEVSALRERREKGSTLVEEAGTDIGVMTSDEVMQELGIDRAQLDTLVREHRLSPLEGVPGLAFTANDVRMLKENLTDRTAFESAPPAAGPTLRYEEVLQELQISREELDTLVTRGQLRPVREGGESRFSAGDVEAVKRQLETKPTMVGGEGKKPAAEGLFMVEDETGDVSLDSVLMEARRPGDSSGLEDALSGEDGLDLSEIPMDEDEEIDTGAEAGGDQQTSIIPDESTEEDSEESIFDFAEDDLDLDSSDSSVVDIRVGSGASDQNKPSSGVLQIGDSLKLDVDESSDLIQIDEEISSSEILDLDSDESDESSAESDIVTDVLHLGEEESSDENILGDIIPADDGVIEEVTELADGAEVTAPEDTMTVGEDTMTVGETIDATADVTQIDEGGYEGSDLGTVLGEEEAEEYDEGEVYEEEAYSEAALPPEAVAVAVPEAPMHPVAVVAMVIAVLFLIWAGIFHVSTIRGSTNSLTRWALEINRGS